MENQIILKNLGIKITPKRLAVLEILRKSQEPVDIKFIEKELNKKKIQADRVTLYRIIKVFTKAGLTKKIDFLEGKFRYEYADKPHHHHIICNKCGKIDNLEGNFFEKFINKVKNKTDYIITDHTLEIFGVCSHCQ